MVAVLVRLLAMPFFMHMDLLSEYRRVNYAVENGVWFSGINRLATFWIECGFYWLSQWAVIGRDLLLYLPNPEHSTSSPTRHFIFVGDPYVFRHIFLFKLPYLLFDLLAARLVWRYFAGSSWQFAATAFWLFNPVTFYASYLFGRFEVISLFFLIATALMFQQKRLIAAAIAFGIALNCREINVLLLPAFLIATWFHVRNENISAKRSLATIVILIFLWRFPHILQALFDAQSPFTSPSSIVDIDRGVSAVLNNQFAGVYPFILLFAGGLLWLASKPEFESPQVFVSAGLISMSAFFITGLQSAHYFAWIIPFMLLLVFHNRQALLPMLGAIVGWLCYWLLNPEGAYFTPLLATPIHESFFGLGNLSQVYQSHWANHPLLDVKIMRQILFTGTVACLLVLTGMAMQAKPRSST